MYVLRLNRREFIQISENENEFIVTKDVNKASKFEKIGDAMKVAAKANEILEEAAVRAVLI